MKVLYCFPKGKPKALTMSYDDGNIADRRLVSIFNKYGIKGTFNLNFGRMRDTSASMVTKSEISKLYKSHEVASHTAHHSYIACCPMTYVADEVIEDRKGLESLTGYIVRGHAYPSNSYNREIEELYRDLGIAYGRTTDANQCFNLPANPMEWHPTCHQNDPKLMEYGRYFVEHRKLQYRMMCVWGHSYELDRDNSWHIIDGFCKFMGGREDIWYATNIEIIDYMEVVKNLQFNASCTGVYNPSAASAWIKVGEETIVEAKGGCFTTL